MTGQNVTALASESNTSGATFPKNALAYNGIAIRDRNEMLSLTDMWRAAGSPENREPFNWARFEGRSFVEAVALAHNLSETQVFASRQGRNGGTWAHWQIGLAYAKYLSPEFHMWCNEVVRAHMEGRPAPMALPADVLEMIRRSDGVARATIHKVTVIEQALAAMAAQAANMQEAIRAEIARQSFILRRGQTAGQIWKQSGFPARRGFAVWFGNRLAELGCQIEGGGRGELGSTRARLFDPDKAALALKNGLALIVQQKIAERQGQGRLKLV